ncbi:hypothetical protein [Malaciobacter marinus]|nr:hypothetical protein [Malaciobacter marinus]SKB69864.1 hypothetical protein SAMN06295997_13229 [Malaciobacter marinus]
MNIKKLKDVESGFFDANQKGFDDGKLIKVVKNSPLSKKGGTKCH